MITISRIEVLNPFATLSDRMLDQAARSALAAGRMLVPELLGIECIRRAGNTNKHRQGDQSGYDGLHGCYSRRCRQHRCCLSSMTRTMDRFRGNRCLAGDSFQNHFSHLLHTRSPPNGGHPFTCCDLERHRRRTANRILRRTLGRHRARGSNAAPWSPEVNRSGDPASLLLVSGQQRTCSNLPLNACC